MPTDYSWLEPDRIALRDLLIASEREFINLDIADTAPRHPWQTQIGGQPYLVDATEFPRDSDGNPMAFLIQLNFSELPTLAGYPTEGLLQFFVASDETFGMGFGGEPGQFHLRFHPTITPDWHPSNPLPALIGEEDTPLCNPLDPLFATGTLDRMPVLSCDDRFQAIRDELGSESTGFEDEGTNVLGSRVGGYPYFVQYDDREKSRDLLLLQLDSDGGAMEWGDSGCAQLFISEADLAARNFANVQYCWNCM